MLNLKQYQTISTMDKNVIKVDIFQNDRHCGTLRVKHCMAFPIDLEKLQQEVERRLPTLKHEDYQLTFVQ